MKKILLSLTLLSLSFSAAPAFALTYSKTVEGSRNVIYVSGGTAGQSVQLEELNHRATIARMPNGCGMIRVNKPSAGWPESQNDAKIIVNGTTNVNPYALTTLATVPTCTGSTLSPAQTANFKDGSDNVYIVGLTANTAVSLSIPTSRTKSATFNACGFARFSDSDQYPWVVDVSQFNLRSGTSLLFSFYNLDNFTLAQNPPLCRKIGSNYVLYQAAP